MAEVVLGGHDRLGVSTDPGRQHVILTSLLLGFRATLSRHEAEQLHQTLGTALQTINVAHSKEPR